MIIKLFALILIAQQADDVDFGAFPKDKPVVKSSSVSSFPAQTLPKTIKDSLPKVKEPPILQKVDKFGRKWQHVNQVVLDNYIDEINKKPFTLIDKFGQTWESQDKDALECFIAGRNNLFESIYGTGQ